MPTPVSTARQCLTQEATAALEEAVAVAKRRGHSQTTSLHMVSSLLSNPNSNPLREACMHARNSFTSYTSRVQLKALELSLSVSLDRLPSSSKVEEPPVSNSLMAAVKRSQASQRRQPENFSFHHQQQQDRYCNSSSSSGSSVPVVKVELKNLILSILDDPLVSRVFAEAGFRSCDVKISLIRPGFGSLHVASVYGAYSASRYRRSFNNPPMFLCNFGEGIPKCLNFPFMGSFSGDEQGLEKIGGIMVREKRRNPLLLGLGASQVLGSFLETMKTGDDDLKGLFPQGLSVVNVKDEILKFSSEDSDERIRFKLDEVEKMVGKKQSVVVNLGDLEVLDGICVDKLRFLVSDFGKLLDLHRGKLWLIGAAGSCDVYFKILGKVSDMDKDLDLEMLPITSLRFSMGGSYPRSSLMESFVPLGGFFSMPSESKSPVSGRCHLCNDKFEQELASLAEEYRSTLPCRLRKVESTQLSSASSKGQDDDRLPLNAKIMELRKKWDNVCQQSHYKRNLSKVYDDQFPRVSNERDENARHNEISHSKEYPSLDKLEDKIVNSGSSQRSPSVKELSSIDLLAKPESLSSRSDRKEKKGDDLKSPASATSMSSNNLGLGVGSVHNTQEQMHYHGLNESESSSPRFFDNPIYTYAKDPKLLYKTMVDRVGNHHQEAVRAFLHAITRCQTGVNRSHFWMNLDGPDRFVKKKLGLALAEILHGSTESFVYADLSFEVDMRKEDSILYKTLEAKNSYKATMRGTVIDYLVEKLSKRPCVVFLDHIDKADVVLQNSLFRAIESGRLVDLSGREANIANSIFLGSHCSKSLTKFEDQCSNKYSEEDVMNVKGCSIKLVIGYDLNDDPTSDVSHRFYAGEKGFFEMNQINKRKLVCCSRSTEQAGFEVAKRANRSSNSYLDLNLPAEESEAFNTCYVGSDDSDSRSEDSRSMWLDDFERRIDQVVVFEPFDFGSVADKLCQETNRCLNNVVGSCKCSMEIERKVVLQIIAASYMYGNKKVEDWVRSVVRKCFAEVMERFDLSCHSIVKLVACEGIDLCEELSESDGLLPARIIIN